MLSRASKCLSGKAWTGAEPYLPHGPAETTYASITNTPLGDAFSCSVPQRRILLLYSLSEGWSWFNASICSLASRPRRSSSSSRTSSSSLISSYRAAGKRRQSKSSAKQSHGNSLNFRGFMWTGGAVPAHRLAVEVPQGTPSRQIPCSTPGYQRGGAWVPSLGYPGWKLNTPAGPQERAMDFCRFPQKAACGALGRTAPPLISRSGGLSAFSTGEPVLPGAV